MRGNRGWQMASRMFYGLLTFGMMGFGGVVGSIAGVLLAEYIRTPFEAMRGFLPARRGWRSLPLHLVCSFSPLLTIIAIYEFGSEVRTNPFRYTSIANDVVQFGISLAVMFFVALLLDELPPRRRPLNDAASDAVAALVKRIEIVHADPDPVRS